MRKRKQVTGTSKRLAEKRKRIGKTKRKFPLLDTTIANRKARKRQDKEDRWLKRVGG